MWPRRPPWILVFCLLMLMLPKILLVVDSVPSSSGSSGSEKSGRDPKRLRKAGVVAATLTAVATLAVGNAALTEGVTPIEAYEGEKLSRRARAATRRAKANTAARVSKHRSKRYVRRSLCICISHMCKYRVRSCTGLQSRWQLTMQRRQPVSPPVAPRGLQSSGS